MKIFLTLSTQLFEFHYLNKDLKNNIKIDIFFIIEDDVYFTSHKFHKLKLAYHRASMKYYYDYLFCEFTKFKQKLFVQILLKFNFYCLIRFSFLRRIDWY